jgi:hypothetical protein
MLLRLLREQPEYFFELFNRLTSAHAHAPKQIGDGHAGVEAEGAVGGDSGKGRIVRS